MAAKSKGFFCAKTIAIEASVRINQRRIHDDCNARGAANPGCSRLFSRRLPPIPPFGIGWLYPVCLGPRRDYIRGAVGA
jgi:hypothetical protein